MENKIKSFSGETCAHQNTEHSKILISAAQNEFKKDVLAFEFVHHMYMSRNKNEKA